MKVSEAVQSFQQYKNENLKPATLQGYFHLLKLLSPQFGRKNVENITSEDIRYFLKSITKGHSPGTKRLRWNQTKAFFAYCIRELNIDMINPCDDKKVKKLFKVEPIPKSPLNQDIIKRMLSKVKKDRDKLIVDLLGKAGLEAGEILALKPSHVRGRKVKLDARTYAYLPQKLAFRLKEYIQNRGIGPQERIFKLSYSGFRMIILRYSKSVNRRITPNDLRKHAGISAHNKGVPLEFISKVMYRHRSLETTMKYLGLSRVPRRQKDLYKWIDRLEK